MSKTESDGHKYTNALINETSPYLLQHAHNPVNWHAWNDAALEKAKKENKLLIISIGYAACHWCHVMEHESFEDSTVAAVMNEHFIAIKVDREERPDIDDVYMTACQLVSNRGCGWPLNAFALPDGRPVWAGTYFPKDQWLNILEQFQKLAKEDYAKLEASAARITEGINDHGHSDLVDVSDKTFTEEIVGKISRDFLSNIDFEEGGRLGAPKFPMPNNYEFLLRYHHLTKDQKALDAAVLTLDKMANGGIYDQIGGGFARYSVDAIWHVPHFEKMLYDNGQLMSLYAQAYKLTKNERYREIIEQTASFVRRELSSPEGGFYSSLDADSEGEEGKFYVWSADEVDAAISHPETAAKVKKYYDVTAEGNWEGSNILRIAGHSKDEVSATKRTPLFIQEANEKLMAARANRVRPGLDDKILTSWNALMAKGLLDAFSATGDAALLEMAEKNIDFVLEKQMQKDGRLNRNYKDGRSTINAFLDDYAALIDALIRRYEITFNETHINTAKLLTEYVLAHFKSENGFFFYTSDLDPPLVARKKELTDNVIPGSNSMMARNLYKLGELTYNPEYIELSRIMILNMIDQIVESEQPNFYSNWCQLYLEFYNPPYEIAILGPEAQKLNMEMQEDYHPNAVFLGGTSEGSLALLKDKLQDEGTYIYVCKNKVCKFPVDNAEAAVKLMD